MNNEKCRVRKPFMLEGIIKNEKHRGRKPYKSIVEEIAKIVAEHLFDDMQNPEWRGKNFNENTFNIEHHVCAMVPLHLPFKMSHKKDLVEACAKAGRLAWEAKIKELQ